MWLPFCTCSFCFHPWKTIKWGLSCNNIAADVIVFTFTMKLTSILCYHIYAYKVYVEFAEIITCWWESINWVPCLKISLCSASYWWHLISEKPLSPKNTSIYHKGHRYINCQLCLTFGRISKDFSNLHSVEFDIFLRKGLYSYRCATFLCIAWMQVAEVLGDTHVLGWSCGGRYGVQVQVKGKGWS